MTDKTTQRHRFDLTTERVMAVYRCECGRLATHVHLLPYDHLARPPERAVLACERCDPGGLWTTLDSWLVGARDTRYVDDGSGEPRYTTREHYLDTKRHGRAAVELVDALLDVELDVRREAA